MFNAVCLWKHVAFKGRASPISVSENRLLNIGVEAFHMENISEDFLVERAVRNMHKNYLF